MEKTTLDLWGQLEKVATFEFSSNCRKIPPSYEPRKGSGQIIVKDPSSETITFFERGKWSSVQSKEPIAFTNILRWRRDRKTGLISLEHLRMGVDQPVLLFTLAPVGEFLYKSLHPHECKEDTYTGSILFDHHYIHLDWRITGPKKNELLSIVYS